MAEYTTIARPYAQAVFELAQGSDTLAEWSGMLDLLSTVTEDPTLRGLLKSARLEKQQWADLLLSVCGDGLTDEGKNLVKVLTDNHKFALLPEINRQYQTLKAEQEGYVTVEVISTYALNPQHKQQISDALKARLGKEIVVNATIDRDLLGGWLIRIGNQVLDLTVRGRLQQLTAGLRH